MACFLVPTTEAIVTTIVQKVVKNREKKAEGTEVTNQSAPVTVEVPGKVTLSRKLSWLNNMLWGGSALLMFEHVWHGEVVPWFPFLTNAANAQDAAEMLHEMGTVGVTMAVAVTAVWGVVVLISNALEKRSAKEEVTEEVAK